MRVYGITIQAGRRREDRYRIVFDPVHSIIGKPGRSFLDLRDEWTERFGPITSFQSLGGPYEQADAAQVMESVMPGRKIDSKQLAAGERE